MAKEFTHGSTRIVELMDNISCDEFRNRVEIRTTQIPLIVSSVMYIVEEKRSPDNRTKLRIGYNFESFEHGEKAKQEILEMAETCGAVINQRGRGY